MKYRSLNDVMIDDYLWRKYAIGICKSEYPVSEVVDKLYLSIGNLFDKYPDKILTKSYIYTSLTNIYIRVKNRGVKLIYDIDLCEISSDDREYDSHYDNVVDEVYGGITSYLNAFRSRDDWFHKTLFKYVFVDKISIRELAKRTGIPFITIQKSVAMTKGEIVKNFGEQYDKCKKG